MSRLNWFKRYFTESNAWHSVYLVLAGHLAFYLTRYIGLPVQKSILALFIVALIIPIIAFYRFLLTLWRLSKTEVYPSDTFTYELAKTIPNFILAIVFAIPSIQALTKYGKAFPVSATLFEFTYAYSIGFWLFFAMSLLLNRKGDK